MAVTAVTHACRAALLLAAAWITVLPASANSLLQAAWDRMRHSAWVRHDTFEPSLVVVTFFFSILFFYILDTGLGKWTKRWRASINPSDDMRAWNWDGGRRVIQEGGLYIVPLAILDYFFPRRWLPAAAPSAAQLLGEVLLCLFLYDALFTLGHVLCHKVSWLYKRCHAKHHQVQAVRAPEVIRLTPWEEGLDVLCSVAAVNLCGAHPMSRCIYNILIVYLLTELHSGYEFPWMLQDVVPWGLWGGSRAHALHHQRGNVGFQKFFTYLDRLMGTDATHGGRARRGTRYMEQDGALHQEPSMHGTLGVLGLSALPGTTHMHARVRPQKASFMHLAQGAERPLHTRQHTRLLPAPCSPLHAQFSGRWAANRYAVNRHAVNRHAVRL